jgi:hypothetical protein
MGNENWKTIEPGVWKAGAEGDSITGVLVAKEQKDEQKVPWATQNYSDSAGMNMSPSSS